MTTESTIKDRMVPGIPLGYNTWPWLLFVHLHIMQCYKQRKVLNTVDMENMDREYAQPEGSQIHYRKLTPCIVSGKNWRTKKVHNADIVHTEKAHFGTTQR